MKEEPMPDNYALNELANLADRAHMYGGHNPEGLFLERNIVLRRETPADGDVTYNARIRQYVAGSGPEEASASSSANPNWLRNKARNYLAIADHIEQEEARRDEERARKQEIARHHAKGFGTGVLASMTAAQQAIVDHIYDLERQVAAGIIDKAAGQ